MSLPFAKIFIQAIRITRANKFLWIFGLLLVSGQLVNYTLGLEEKLPIDPILGLVGLIVLIILNFRAKAGLIIAVKAIIEKQDTSLKTSFAFSKLFYQRILAIAILVQLGLLILATLISAPIFFLYDHGYLIRALLLGIFGLGIFIPTMLLGVFINLLSPMFVVLFDLTISEAFRRSFELIMKHWPTLIAFGFLLFIVEFIAFSPLVFLGFLAYHSGGLIYIIFGSIVFLLMQPLVAVFSQTAWVLAFTDLIKPQKLADPEPVAVPEVITGD
ncbi:MAG: hypothetical protein A2660_00950 [Candidatus Doudnabacteria bacterium RIFCSPHIGHO2_01_FULL_45_18]|uniref:DUF7847 domain-containing protein n=1 Tax=Candidatus Doudnabacteria bacterium RIFCSPHIGHO2_01_FULL_45_18 TaxID=1817823 RepID=A0A1F5NSJ8_9BACT|nr:MAG: hypothetical protein A2660_00950 [Candidatus Doudnabacteria bacterium RIFCSPHIGHO2_01_FULL_45_18]